MSRLWGKVLFFQNHTWQELYNLFKLNTRFFRKWECTCNDIRFSEKKEIKNCFNKKLWLSLRLVFKETFSICFFLFPERFSSPLFLFPVFHLYEKFIILWFTLKRKSTREKVCFEVFGEKVPSSQKKDCWCCNSHETRLL